MNEAIELSIGRRIKTMRVLCWLTQQKFAESVGVSRRQVAYWESDHDVPGGDRISKICEVLNVTPDWLLTGRWIKEAYSAKHSLKNKQAHMARMEELQRLKARLYRHLPIDLNSSDAGAEWLDATPEDQGSYIVCVPDRSLAPVYEPGDRIYLKPCDWKINEDAMTQLSPFDGRQVNVVNNSISSLKILEFSRRRGLSLVGIGRRASRSRVSAGQRNMTTIQGVVYKYVRQV
jgi:transcriptional regulator with XRE-family HTH domain